MVDAEQFEDMRWTITATAPRNPKKRKERTREPDAGEVQDGGGSQDAADVVVVEAPQPPPPEDAVDDSHFAIPKELRNDKGFQQPLIVAGKRARRSVNPKF